MNKAQLLRLADEQNSNLIKLVNKWIENKGKDPILDAMMINTTLAEAILMMILAVTGAISAGFTSSGMAIITVAVAATLLGYCIIKLNLYGYMRINVDDFIKAISILENCFGPLEDNSGRSGWVIAEYGQIETAESYLKLQAKEVKRFEAIPWESKRAQREKQIFIREHSLISRLISITKGYGHYFS